MPTLHKTGPVDIQSFDVLLASSVPANLIDVGFPVARDTSGFIYPAAAETWNTDLATTAAAFVVKFVGIASGRSRLASTDSRDTQIPVDMDGTFIVDVTSATFVVGDFVGPAKAAGNALLNTFVKTTVKTTACFIVVDNYPVATTQVLARLINSLPKK